MINRMWSVYALVDPRDGRVRYVGWSYNVRKRLQKHIRESATDTTYKACWIKGLSSAGRQPAAMVIEAGYGDGWGSAERKWIRHYRALRCDLTNLTDGGEGVTGLTVTAEHRRKLSQAGRGRMCSEETKAKISVAHTGKVGHLHGPETRARMSAAHKGQPSPRGMLGKKNSELCRRTTAERNRTRIYTPEMRRKIGDASRARWTPEAKARLSAANRDREVTAESRRKMSEAQLRIHGKVPLA